MEAFAVAISASAVSPAIAAAIFLIDTWDKCHARRVVARSDSGRPAEHHSGRWMIVLLVDADEPSHTVRPLLQIYGPPLPPEITVELWARGMRGKLRVATKRRFRYPLTGSDLVLGTLALPDGLSMVNATNATWTVVVSHGDQEIARRWGPLAATPCLNEEAELLAADLLPDLVPDPRPEPETQPATLVTARPVRHLRWTIGLAIPACILGSGAFAITMLSAWLWFTSALFFGAAIAFLTAAALALFTTCPRCRNQTVVVGRTGAQQCDSCNHRFTLGPSSV